MGQNYFATAELPDTLDWLVENIALNAKLWDEHPELVRALALTRVGNSVRSVRRVRRLEKLDEALREVTDSLSAAERRQAEGVFRCLDNMLAWVTCATSVWRGGWRRVEVGDGDLDRRLTAA